MPVYFIQCGRGGPIKIGKADNVRIRIEHLRSSTWHDLIVLGVMKGSGRLRGDDRSMEAMLHARFAKAHIAREWFRPTAELRAFIAQHAEHDGTIDRPSNKKRGVQRMPRQKPALTTGAEVLGHAIRHRQEPVNKVGNSIGVSPTLLTGMLSGKEVPNQQQLAKINDFFGLNLKRWQFIHRDAA